MNWILWRLYLLQALLLIAMAYFSLALGFQLINLPLNDVGTFLIVAFVATAFPAVVALVFNGESWKTAGIGFILGFVFSVILGLYLFFFPLKMIEPYYWEVAVGPGALGSSFFASGLIMRQLIVPQ